MDWTVFLTANQIVVRRNLVKEETFISSRQCLGSSVEGELEVVTSS